MKTAWPFMKLSIYRYPWVPFFSRKSLHLMQAGSWIVAYTSPLMGGRLYRNLRSLMPRLWLNRRMGRCKRARGGRKGLMTDGVYQERKEYQVYANGVLKTEKEREKKGFVFLVTVGGIHDDKKGRSAIVLYCTWIWKKAGVDPGFRRGGGAREWEIEEELPSYLSAISAYHKYWLLCSPPAIVALCCCVCREASNEVTNDLG